MTVLAKSVVCPTRFLPHMRLYSGSFRPNYDRIRPHSLKGLVRSRRETQRKCRRKRIVRWPDSSKRSNITVVRNGIFIEELHHRVVLAGHIHCGRYILSSSPTPPFLFLSGSAATSRPVLFALSPRTKVSLRVIKCGVKEINGVRT